MRDGYGLSQVWFMVIFFPIFGWCPQRPNFKSPGSVANCIGESEPWTKCCKACHTEGPGNLKTTTRIVFLQYTDCSGSAIMPLPSLTCAMTQWTLVFLLGIIFIHGPRHRGFFRTARIHSESTIPATAISETGDHQTMNSLASNSYEAKTLDFSL